MATLINDKPIEKKPYTNTNVYTKENVSIYEYRMKFFQKLKENYKLQNFKQFCACFYIPEVWNFYPF